MLAYPISVHLGCRLAIGDFDCPQSDQQGYNIIELRQVY